MFIRWRINIFIIAGRRQLLKWRHVAHSGNPVKLSTFCDLVEMFMFTIRGLFIARRICCVGRRFEKRVRRTDQLLVMRGLVSKRPKSRYNCLIVSQDVPKKLATTKMIDHAKCK